MSLKLEEDDSVDVRVAFESLFQMLDVDPKEHPEGLSGYLVVLDKINTLTEKYMHLLKPETETGPD